MAVFLDLGANELKAAAEEKRRVRAATNFMVVEFVVSFEYCSEGIMRVEKRALGMELFAPTWRGR
jgi:hypothetical protein